MWSDNETAIDLLGFQHLVSAVTCVARDDRLLPTTIGVFGDWGSGKSSLIQMATAQLSQEPDTLVVSFNGWLFEGFEDAKCALMGTILDEIEKRDSIGLDAKKLVKKLVSRIDWFRVLCASAKYGAAATLAGPLALGALAAADVVKHVAQTVKDVKPDELEKLLIDNSGHEVRKAVRDFRSDFEAMLADSDIRRLVVVIDDLDRCMPDTVIETLEAIKLFLFVKRTAFIIGADERLVQYAVRRRFPELPGERAEVGRDYLEKLIQFPLRVPQLGPSEMETYINCLFAEAANLAPEQFEKIRECATTCKADSLLDVRFNHAAAAQILGTVPDRLAEQLRIAQRITPVLTTQLSGNPRQCKRFLNTLMIRLQMAKSRGIELNQKVLAKLMLLELFKPEAFRSLGKMQADQGGRPKELALLEKSVTGSATADADIPLGDGKRDKGSKRKASSQEDDQSGGASLSPDQQLIVDTWLADPAIRDWLLTVPALADVDLRAYFFFSRDKLGSFGEAAQRLSPVAQQMLRDVVGESDVIRQGALEKAKDLSPADATAIFEAIADQVRAEDDGGAEGSALARMMEWVNARHDLFAQLIALLASMPDRGIMPSFVPRLRSLARATNQEPLARSLIQKWGTSSTNSILRKAASEALKPKTDRQ